MSAHLILASQSEIRAEMLRRAGIVFETDTARVDEESMKEALLAEDSHPRDIADALAEAKARKVAGRHPNALVLGCDQVLGFQRDLFSKPESPEDAVRRETEEEIGLPAQIERFLGPYPFFQMNQLLLVYHVRIPDGPVVLDQSELAAYREVPVHKLRPWPQGTGPALGDWLRSRGFNPEPLAF